MLTKVINIRSKTAQTGPNGNWYYGPERGLVIPEDMVYIGRPGRGMTGQWGNPFPLTQESERADVLVRYMEWLHDQMVADPSLKERIKALRGKTLVCFCAPKLCHGHVLAFLAENLK